MVTRLPVNAVLVPDNPVGVGGGAYVAAFEIIAQILNGLVFGHRSVCVTTRESYHHGIGSDKATGGGGGGGSRASGMWHIYIYI